MKNLIHFFRTVETSVDPCLCCYFYFGLLMDYLPEIPLSP